MAVADRVDGWEADDVESHRRHRLQAFRRGAQRARLHRTVGPDLGALRPREHLVPGADERALPVDEHRVGVGGGDMVAHCAAIEGGQEREGGGQPLDGRHVVLEQVVRHHAAGRVGPATPAEQGSSLGEGDLDVDVRGEAGLGVADPGRERVVPRLDAERPRAGGVGADHGGPVVVAEVGHPHGRLVASVGPGQDDGGANDAPALTEHPGPHRELLAWHGLDREPSALDLGTNPQNRNACDHAHKVVRGRGVNMAFPLSYARCRRGSVTSGGHQWESSHGSRSATASEPSGSIDRR